MSRGRPTTTSHAEVERVALDLFTRRGFEQTTVDDIAAALGVGRRTIFRYFRSKNDIVWGDFERVIERLRAELAAQPLDKPPFVSLAHAVVASNRYPREDLPTLRQRMLLITSVPALQAHAMLRYAEWRAAAAEFVATRLGVDASALAPQVFASVALGAAMAAFTCWTRDPGDDLERNLADAFDLVVEGRRS